MIKINRLNSNYLIFIFSFQQKIYFTLYNIFQFNFSIIAVFIEQAKKKKKEMTKFLLSLIIFVED